MINLKDINVDRILFSLLPAFQRRGFALIPVPACYVHFSRQAGLPNCHNQVGQPDDHSLAGIRG